MGRHSGRTFRDSLRSLAGRLPRADDLLPRLPHDLRRPVAMLGLSSVLLVSALGIDAAGRATGIADSSVQAEGILAAPSPPADEEAVGDEAAEEQPAPTGEPQGQPQGDRQAAVPGEGATREASEAVAAEPDDEREARPSSELIGFYVNWDDKSYASLEKHIDDLTIVMPEWYHIGSDGRLDVANAERQERALKLIREKNPDLRIMPIVNNFGPAASPADTAKMLEKRGMRKRIAEDIVRTMKRNGFDGVNVDFEGLTASSRVDLVRFMRELYPLAKEAGLEVSQDVLASSETYDYEALARYSDYLIPMMYDEHWKGSPSGPISSQGWYEGALRKFLERVPPEKVVVALGTYGYQWTSGSSRAKPLTYPDARSLASGNDRPIKLHDGTLNSTFAYRSGGDHHRIWLLDAVSAYNQVRTASEHRPRGYAIWRLGGEDPKLWEVLNNRDSLDESVAERIEEEGRHIEYDDESGLITGQRVSP